MVFEEFHCADTGLLDFVDHLLEWSRSVPIYVVTLARPELIERRSDWGAGKRNFKSLCLDPLPDAAMRRLRALRPRFGPLARPPYARPPPPRFRRNEVIFHQGDPGDSLLIIAEGTVKILLPSAEGEEAIIATLRVGDFFGELALLSGAPRSATATALEPSETLVLPRDVFREVLDQEPSLRDALLAGIVAELRRLTGQVEELCFLDLAGRLAMRLVRLAQDAQRVRPA